MKHSPGPGSTRIARASRIVTNPHLLRDVHAEAYRELRLESLRQCPWAYGASFDEEKELPLEEFRRRLRPHGDRRNGIFGVFAESGELAGMLGFARQVPPKRRHIVEIVGLYVRPSHRRRGIARRLLNAAIARAETEKGVRQLQLSVTAGNSPATELYLRRGFQVFGHEHDALQIDGEFCDFEHMVYFLSGARMA